MPRTTGSTTETSLQIKQQILSLHAGGMSKKDIAARVGKDRSYVSRIIATGIPASQQAKADAITLALEIKASSTAGAGTIAWQLATEHGISPDAIPHTQLLHQRFSSAGLSSRRPGTRNDNRSYHTYFRDGLNAPCQRVQVDGAGPFSIAGETFYVLIAQDRFSRLLYAEFMPHAYGAHLQPFACNLVDHFGVPIEVQLDNAITWRATSRHPGKLAWSLFSLGIERVHFIPEAQPTRNGGIERQVGTFKSEFLAGFENEYGLTFLDLADAQAKLAAFVSYYNHKRQHTALPKRSGNRRFHLTPAEAHVMRTERAAASDQCISFSRYLGQGYAVLHSSVVAAFPEMAERYVTFECRLDGTGIARHSSSVVGTFCHNFTNKNPDCSLCFTVQPVNLDSATPQRFKDVDPLAYAKRLLEDNRHKRPRTSRLPRGWELEIGDDGLWQLFDASGELIVDWLNSDADHIAEYVSAWELAA